MTKVRIAPSILAADFTKLGEQVKAADAGGADLFHIDIMDGQFVPNISMGPMVVEAVRRVTNLPLDVHLMIVEPERYITAFADAGATSISVHVEASRHLHRTLQQIHDLGCKAGVAINPHTPASVLSEIMHLLDVILVMTVNPGFGGQRFIHSTLSKISQFKAMIDKTGREIDLEVDGGINQETAKLTVQAGANTLIAGHFIFEHPQSIQAGIQALRQL